MGIEEEAEPGGKFVDGQPRGHGRLHVGEPVGQGEGQLLGGRRARFADVVPRHRHRVEAGISAAQNRITSTTTRIDGRGGKMYSFWAWYSFSMSFCKVPPRARRDVPALSPACTYMASTMAAGELIVIEVVMAPRSISANRSSMSAKVSTATPQRPTSPSLCGSSESRPMRVGRSKATDSPPPPDRRSSRKRTSCPRPSRTRRTSASSTTSTGTSTRRPRVNGACPGQPTEALAGRRRAAPVSAGRRPVHTGGPGGSPTSSRSRRHAGTMPPRRPAKRRPLPVASRCGLLVGVTHHRPATAATGAGGHGM